MGTFAYGDSYYGLRAYDQTTGVVEDSAAIGAASSTNTATAVNVIDASANTIQGTSATASAALEVYDAAATITPSASTNSSGTKVREGSATASASASTNASGLRIGESSATASAEAVGQGSGVFSITVAVSFSGQATVSPTINRVRKSPSTVVPVSATAAIGREKWERITNDSNTWTTIAA